MTAGTTVVSLDTRKRGRKLSGPGVACMAFDLTIGTGDLEADDILEAGYVPAGVTVIAFLVTTTALDSDGTPIVTFDIQLGTTSLISASTQAQLGGSDLIPVVPTTTTAPTVVRFKTITAPTAAQAGTARIKALYFSA